MNEFFVFLILCFITIIGYTTIKFFQLLEQNDMLVIPYSFGLGTGLISFQMYIYSRMGIHWNREVLLIPWIGIGLFYLLSKRKMVIQKIKISKTSFINLALLISILLLSFFVGFEAIIRPLSAWDGWTTWLLRAKILYFEGNINAMVFQHVQSDYPLVISLVSAFIYIVLGSVDDRAVLLFFYSFYFSLGLLFFLYLQKKTSFRFSLLGTFLLLSTQNLIRHGGRYEAGQADLALGFFIFCCFTLLVSYLKNYKLKTLILLNIFLAITSMVKNEGIPFAFFVELISVYFIFRSKKFAHIYALAFFIITFIDWHVFKMSINAPSLPLYIGIPYLSRTEIVSLEMGKEFFNIQNWNLLWICLIASIPLSLVVKRDKEIYIIYFLILIQLVSYYFVFLGTRVDPILHVRDTIDRLLLHIAPLAVCLIILLLNKSIKVWK